MVATGTLVGARRILGFTGPVAECPIIEKCSKCGHGWSSKYFYMCEHDDCRCNPHNGTIRVLQRTVNRKHFINVRKVPQRAGVAIGSLVWPIGFFFLLPILIGKSIGQKMPVPARVELAELRQKNAEMQAELEGE